MRNQYNESKEIEMYPNNRNYKYDEETAREGEDYWYINHMGERIRQRKADGGGTITEFGGPCGSLYTDENGDS